ncbi:MAG: MraY family glycosyltransferase, partial [Candidatus Eisenbacteria bacterium]
MHLVSWSLVILGSAAALSWALMKPVARLGLSLGLVDLPSSRRTRARPVPTTGGIVIFLTTAASLIFALRFFSYVAPNVAFALSALLAGGTVIVVLGMIDDRINLRPGVKLVVQIAVAIAMVASGVALERVRFFFGPAFELGWLSYPITVFWLVGFMNAFNLIDGLDGLAGGIAVVAAAGLFVVGLTNNNPLLYMMIAGIFGSGIGFLLHNFREGNIYLGDAGSMALGFFLAGGAVIGGYNDVASNAVLVVGACMVVPAFDVITTIVRRGRAKSGVMTPDQSHTHHRLIRFGLNPKATVIVLWGVTLFFGWQMLGLVAPFGLVYMLGSYVVALGVVNVLVEQRRKNLKTIQSDLRDEMLYLVGS